MSDPVSWLLVEPGWKVLGAGGDDLGRVAEVLGDEENDIFDGLVVSPRLLGKPRYLPSERVGRIETGLVHATVEDTSELRDYSG